MTWHVILCDELGEEFSVTIISDSVERVRETVAEQYPECGLIAITSTRLAGSP